MKIIDIDYDRSIAITDEVSELHGWNPVTKRYDVLLVSGPVTMPFSRIYAYILPRIEVGCRFFGWGFQDAT